MSIFLENAPLYWGVGLPVIPLKRWNSPGKGAGKAPILNEWTAYSTEMPSEAMQQSWLRSYSDSNIGLPFGPKSGLCAIDIDTEDANLIKAIRDALPPSPWVRVGQKGMGLIYKWSGQANFKLRDSDNNSLVEFLGKGNQMVLPPSIHPKTEKPYTSNSNLWEVLDQIKPLPTDLEQVLRSALGGLKGVSLAQTGRSGPVDVVPQGERDIQMVRHAGYLARVVLGIDKNQKFTLNQAMEHMRTWVENFTAHSSGDDMDPEKGVAKLVEYLLKDVELGKTLPNGWDADLTKEQRAHPAIAEMIKKNAVQRWTPVKAKDWLEAQISIRPDDLEWALEKIEELTAAVSRDDNFTETHYKMLHDPFKRALGSMLKMSKSDFLGMFREARQGDTEAAADHEAIARQVIEDMNRSGDLRFAQGKFWQWNGSCFNRLEETDVMEEIATSVKGNVLARRQGDYVALTKTVAMLTRSELVSQFEEGINFANGFLDTNLQLNEHSPKYGKTFTMPFNYIPERAGEAHKWLEFLERSWGDDDDYAEKVLALQEAFAATMFGVGTQYQRAILLHGKARSGKTQALEVLRAMMPATAQCSISPTKWAERFQLTDMVGKTLNICGELPEESNIVGDKFKGVVGGEIQSVEYKGRDTFEFVPIATHWFASNFLPRSRDSSEGFSRRWLILDFNRQVPDKERIPDFHRILISEEREAIAAWAVLGLKRLTEQRDYTQPKSHHERLNMTVRSNNSVAAFLESTDKIRATNDPEDWADVRSVFDVYVWYMREVSRGWSVTMERFMQMLDELGHDCSQYKDALGVLRYKAKGIKITTPVLPK